MRYDNRNFKRTICFIMHCLSAYGAKGGKMMPEYIRVKDLSKTYRRHEAVKHISFQVNKGQIFAFLGPNGAGKSTTINILSTLLLKSSGIVRVGGLDLDRQRQAVKQKIGIVFQDDVLDEGLSVYQNLLYRGGLYLSQENVLKQRISELSSLLMLDPILTRKYGDCSGGQKRLAQIARALLPAPGLLILDEPTTGLDPVTRQKVWETLLVLREQLQMTIFFTTHYMEEAAYTDAICVLDHGQILLCDTLDHLGKTQVDSKKQLDLNALYLHLLGENR